MVKPSLSNCPLHKEISTIKQSSLRGHSRGSWRQLASRSQTDFFLKKAVWLRETRRQCNTNILYDNWICHENETSAIAEGVILAKDLLGSGRGPFRLK